MKGGIVPDRTPDQIRSRRALADAASGFQRARVVLYACAPEGRDTAPILAELRDYATARDWVVVADIAEPTSAGVRMGQRTGWCQVVGFIETGRAQGIVMGTHSGCAHDHPDRVRLRQWFGEHGSAFLVPVAVPVAAGPGQAGADHAA
jgi:hypothetical protein